MATNIGVDALVAAAKAKTDSATGAWDAIIAFMEKFRSTSNEFGALAKLDTVPGAIPAGGMIDFGGSAAPSGWLLCDGSAVSRTTYADLFAAIGTTWGAGNGSTTFNVPDRRRRLSMGAGGTVPAGTNGPANTVGATGGNEQIVLTEAQLPAHTHGDGTLSAASGGSHSHGVPTRDGSGSGGTGVGQQTGGAAGTHSTNAGGAHTHDITGATGSTGTGANVPIIPPVVVVTKIIKT